MAPCNDNLHHESFDWNENGAISRMSILVLGMWRNQGCRITPDHDALAKLRLFWPFCSLSNLNDKKPFKV